MKLNSKNVGLIYSRVQTKQGDSLHCVLVFGGWTPLSLFV